MARPAVGFGLAPAVVTSSTFFAGNFAAIVPPLIVVGGLPITGGSLSLARIGGIALCLVNFHILAPLAGWFSERSDPVVQLLAHDFVFGCPVGWVWAAHVS